MNRATIALNRFGLGARPDEAPLQDVTAWLKGQIKSFVPVIKPIQPLESRAFMVRSIIDLSTAQRNMQVRRKNASQVYGKAVGDQYNAQLGVRVQAAVTGKTPFVERLVHFWANHFAVSTEKQTMIGFAGLLELEAIRPHVLGRFEDMLLAVERHPAMLIYLDQIQSIGPRSEVGNRGGRRGLNENLGREILELHTMGVRTGYSQQDVTEFARALTGWTVAGLNPGTPLPKTGTMTAHDGDFIFLPMQHEPGPRTILGKRYAQGGVDQARAVLIDLARHPSTAHHIAMKLARHFGGDTPPPSLVKRLEQAYLKSDGDLATVYNALIDAPESWMPEPIKFRSPWEWVVAALRGLGFNDVGTRFNGLFRELGQPVWAPGSPAGYDDINATWTGTDALWRRVEVAQRLTDFAKIEDPRALAEKLFPDSVSQTTARIIAAAGDAKQGLELLLAAPEMMRR